jgi:hypothetical protein
MAKELMQRLPALVRADDQFDRFKDTKEWAQARCDSQRFSAVPLS